MRKIKAQLVINLEYTQGNSSANQDDIDTALEDLGDKVLEFDDIIIPGFKIVDASYDVTVD